MRIAKLDALRYTTELKINNLFLNGSVVLGETGIVNNPSIPKTTAAKTFANSTDQEILDTMVAAYGSMIEQSKGKIQPNTMIMSLKAYVHLFGPRSAYVNDSIRSWLEANLPGIGTIVGDNFLDGVGAGGDDVMILMDKNEDYYNMSFHKYMQSFSCLSKRYWLHSSISNPFHWFKCIGCRCHSYCGRSIIWRLL